MNVEKTIKERLEQFLADLKSGKPIKVTRIKKVDTPDGPMHVVKKGHWKRKKKK